MYGLVNGPFWGWLWDGVLAVTARTLTALRDLMSNNRRMPPGHPEHLAPCADDAMFHDIVRHLTDVRSTPHHG